MDNSQDVSRRGVESSPIPGRRDKGKKRTQIIMSGYKGQKEEFLNAFHQSVAKDSLNDSSQNISSQYKNESMLQPNETSALNEQILDQQQQDDGGGGGGEFLNETQKRQSSIVDKLVDSFSSGQVQEGPDAAVQNQNRNRMMTSGQKQRKLTINRLSSNLTQSKICRKWCPYQGQDILNDMYFNYAKIYQGSKIQQRQETSNLPLVMKLKEVALKLANSIQTRRQKQLTEQSYQLINDKSYFNDRNEIQQIKINSNIFNQTRKSISLYLNCFNTQQYCQKLLYRISASVPVFSPSNTYKLLWDLLQVLVIILCICFVPLIVVFKKKFQDLLNPIVSWICPILLFLDIFINMNTGFYEKGALIISRRQIFISYLKNNYFSDVLSVVPFIIHYLIYEWGSPSKDKVVDKDKDYQYSEFFMLLILFKISNLSQIIRRIEERYHFTPRTNNIISLVKLLCTVLFVAHIFSQIWLFVAFIEASKTDYISWIQVYKLEDSPWASQYIRAYYYATVTMITVGYGDTVPTNDLEMILCVFTMLIACGVFAYSVNSIGMILMDFSSREKEIKDNLFTINNYMDQKNVNQDLQYKIRQYLEYYWREMKDSNIEKEEKIFSQLSYQLRDELLLEANKLILKESPIFSSNFTDQMIQNTVKLIHELRCAPSETICTEDTQDDCSIYFIQKGEVDIYIDSLQVQENFQSLPQKSSLMKNRVLKSLKKGDHFGGVSFFTGIPRGYSIYSREFTTLLVIKREEFIKLCQNQSSEDYEMFCAIRDNILIYKNYSQLNMACYSCNNDVNLLKLQVQNGKKQQNKIKNFQSHLMGECPLIHYSANKQLVISKHQFSPPQSCDRSHIRKKTSFKTLKNLKYVQKRIAQFCDDDEKDGEKMLDHYETQYGIESLSSDTSQQSMSDYIDSNKDDSSEKSKRVSLSSYAKKNQRQEQNDEDDTSNKFNMIQSEGQLYSSRNIYKLNEATPMIGKVNNNGNIISLGSTGKISQKNISSENVLEESDMTKANKIACDHLLYGSEQGFGINTQTQLGRSYKTWEDKGYSYQISGSQVSRQKSKINNNTFQYSIGSSGSTQQFLNHISAVTEDLIADEKQYINSKITQAKPTHSRVSLNTNYINNEMKYIEDESKEKLVLQYQEIKEILGKFILDVQINSQMSEEQKFYNLNKVYQILDKLKNSTESESVKNLIYKLGNRKLSFNALKLEAMALINSENIPKAYKQIYGGANQVKMKHKNSSAKMLMKTETSSYKDKKKSQKELDMRSQRTQQEPIVQIDDPNKEDLLNSELDVKREFTQYFPHNNSSKVIEIANMDQFERKKKLNKIQLKRKQNKVERKAGRNLTNFQTTHSKYNKLLNTFQNQSEEEEETQDNVSVKSHNRQQSQIKRKISFFGQQRNQKTENSQDEDQITNHNNNNNNDENSQISNIQQQKIQSGQQDYLLNQQEFSSQKSGLNSPKPSVDSSNNQHYKFDERVQDSEQDLNPDDGENIQKNNPQQYSFHLNDQNYQNDYSQENNLPKPANLLTFQRTFGKKKLSEIPENEGGSSQEVFSQQFISTNTKTLNQVCPNNMTDSSSEQHINNISRQSSINQMLGNKRQSNFFNDSANVIDRIYQEYKQQTKEDSQQPQKKLVYQISEVLEKEIMENEENGEKSSQEDLEEENSKPKQQNLMKNIQPQIQLGSDKCIISLQKDEGINAICNMNIDLTDVKKYHNWHNSQDTIQ